MPVYHVLVTDYAWPTLEIERTLLAAVDADLMVSESGAPDDLLRLAPQADAILTCFKQIPPAVLDAAPRCRIVSRYGIGLDNIPVEHATRLGIVVTNVPDFCLDEVADHTLALLLACARRIVDYAQATRAGVWSQQSARPMARLAGQTLGLVGQTLGLVGYGNIAARVAQKARALGLEIMAYTPRLSADALAPWGRATNDLGELLAQADYISIHAPLTEATRGLIDAWALRRMKPTAYLINTARGAIVDERALRWALLEGRIAGAALDVLSQEPPAADHPLLGLENVILTPHAAFYSQEAIADLVTRSAQHVAQALMGQIPNHVVNPAALAQANCRLRA
ncbi:MAG: C-terminal binding protein [Caldilineaceae bacterium]|nr:C-terminal binding protein [Caldilineaceae bacterium]